MKMAYLKDVCDVTMGQAPPGSSYNTQDDGFPLVAGAGDLGPLNPIPKNYTTVPTRISSIGDIILCIRATIGDVNWSDRGYCLGRGVAGLTPHKDILHPQYLWYWLKTSQKVLAREARGSTFKQVSRHAVESMCIPLPPLPEQRRIATILDKANAIRSKRQEAILLADKFIRSLFLDMFGDPVTNPKGFELLGLNHLFNITTGKLNANMASNNGKYPFFTCSKEDFHIDTYAFDTEAIILSGNNATADYSVKHYRGKFNAYQRTYVMTLRDTRNKYCLFRYALELKLNEMKRYSKGTNTKYLTLGILNDIKLQVPPVEIQAEYERIHDYYTQKKTHSNECLNESKILFKSFTQRAFRGEL